MVATFLYRAVAGAAVPVLLPVLAVHPRLRGGLAQRLGRLPAGLPERPVWMHGASAGDVAALVPLAERLQRRGYPVLLSTITRAGERMARRLGGPGLPLLRAPLDLRGTVRRALDRIGPRLLVLECLELWPALIAACAERGVPVAVVNGRLSEQSLRRYARLPSLFRPCFASLALVSALTEEDAARFERAGVERRRIEVRGSSKHAGLKVGSTGPAVPQRLVLASIHAGEEDLLLDWLGRLRQVRTLDAVVAPRYPGRGPALLRALGRRRMPAHLASRGGGVGEGSGSIEVLDTIGELRARYEGASLAFVGGSLVHRGGHNLVEPAACGVPVLFGPSIEHCRTEAAALRAAGAGWEVHGADQLEQVGRALLDDAAAWQRASRAAVAVAGALAGAAGPLADRLSELAEGSGVSRARSRPPATVLEGNHGRSCGEP